jgi:hypothetical protein
MHVQTVPGALADDADLIFDQALTNADPMAEIAAQLQVWKARQKLAGDPGTKEYPAPVRFVGDGDAAFGFELECALEEANALVLGKGVLPTVGIDKAGGESFGCGDLLTERIKVLRDGLPAREDLRNELHAILPE